MASGEGPTGWVPPKLTRSLSSFFATLPQDLLQGHLGGHLGGHLLATVDDAREDGGEVSTTGDALRGHQRTGDLSPSLSDASSSSDVSSFFADC